MRRPTLAGASRFRAVKEAILKVLLAYGIATIGAFAIVTLVRDATGEATHLSSWAGLGKKSPLVASAFALFLLENGSWQTPPIEWTESVNISPQGPNYLSMERVQDQLNVFINGVLVGQVASDRFPTGRVGIGGSTYDDGNATVCIDSLQVWRLE